MDGSASTLSAASVRQQYNRFHANSSNGSASDAAIRNALFEQLLSFSVPVQTMPAVTEPVAKPTEPVDSSESKPEAVDEKLDSDKESDGEPSIAASIPIAVIDPNQPIQPLSDPNTKDALCSLPSEGKVKAKKDGDPANSLVQAKQQDTRVDTSIPATQVIETSTAKQSDQPVADTSVPVVEANAKPVEFVEDRHARRTDRETTSVVQQTAETKPVQAVETEQTTSDRHEQKSGPTQSSDRKESFANNAVQQSNESDEEGRRERWYERDSELRLPETEPASPKDLSSSIDSATAGTDSNSSAVDMKPLELAQTTAAQNNSASFNPSDAVLASAIVQAQSSATAVKPTASVATDKSSVPMSTDSVNATMDAKKATTDGPSDKLVAKDSQKTELSQQERVRLVQRIARSFNRISASGGQINLRLHPEQLGALSVQVNVDGKSMSAQLTTETEEARDIILKELPVLKQRLAEQGYDVTKFQVEVAGQGTEANFGQSSGQTPYDPRDSRSTTGQMDYRRLVNQQTVAATDARAFSPVSLATTSGIDLLG